VARLERDQANRRGADKTWVLETTRAFKEHFAALRELIERPEPRDRVVGRKRRRRRAARDRLTAAREKASVRRITIPSTPRRPP